MAYIGFEACGHCTFAVIDDPDHQKETYKDLAAATRRGLRVERVTADEARATILNYDPAVYSHPRAGVCKRAEPKHKSAPQNQLPLPEAPA